VSWIWFGGLILVLGSVIAMWPQARDVMDRQIALAKRRRGGAAATMLLALAGALSLGGSAQAQDSSSLHAGTVVIEDPEERRLFGRLLCQCGSCQRLPLDSCGCDWAEQRRAELRARMSAGEPPDDLIAAFRGQYGPAAISIPSDEGFDRAMWAIPVALVVVLGGGLFVMGRRWRAKGVVAAPTASEKKAAAGADEADYDARLDEELRRLEGDR
jgi:cytochrome c-type biogenesis protein CcmH/NrfF